MIIIALASTIAALLAHARPGDTVVAPPGAYGPETISNLSFSTPVTLDARKITAVSISIRNVTGLHVLGGSWANVSAETLRGVRWGTAVLCERCHDVSFDQAAFVGPAADAPGREAAGYGLSFLHSDHVAATRSKFTGFRMGLGFGLTSDFLARGNDFGFMTSDGIDVGQGWRGLIENNTFHDTHIISLEHPDGVQIWSRPDTAPTSDITIRRNRVTGSTQGISGFDGTHPLPAGYKLATGRVLEASESIPYGGFERIVIEDNDVNVDAPNGISLINGRDSIIRNNGVSTLPGAKYVSKFYIKPEDGVTHCGNNASAGAGRPAWSDKACPAH